MAEADTTQVELREEAPAAAHAKGEEKDEEKKVHPRTHVDVQKVPSPNVGCRAVSGTDHVFLIPKLAFAGAGGCEAEERGQEIV
eukprot:3498340-Rhodomonas_salina.2